MQLAKANQKISFVETERTELPMTLLQAQEGKEYIIRAIETDDEELDAFLFSLGCYSDEPITVVSPSAAAVVKA